MIFRSKKNCSSRSGTRGMHRTSNALGFSGKQLNSNSSYRWLGDRGWSHSGISTREKIDILKEMLT